MSMQPQDVDQNIFRLKPRYQTPHQDAARAWTWLLVVGVAASVAFREAIALLARFDVKFKGLVLAPARTEDGPIIKEIEKWLRNGRSDRGAEGDGEAGMDEEETARGRRRRRNA